MSAASARLLFDRDDAVLRKTVRRLSRREHRSLLAAAACFLCGQTLWRCGGLICTSGGGINRQLKVLDQRGFVEH